MTDMRYDTTIVNHFDEYNYFYNIRAMGTGANNDKRSTVSVDNSIDLVSTFKGLTLYIFDYSMNLVSSNYYSVYDDNTKATEIGELLMDETQTGYFILLSNGAWDTNSVLDDAMKSFNAKLFLKPRRNLDQYGVVTGLNRTQKTKNGQVEKHCRMPYVAIGDLGQNIIIGENLGSSISNTKNPDAHLDVSVPHETQLHRTSDHRKHYIGIQKYTLNSSIEGEIFDSNSDHLQLYLNYISNTRGYILLKLYNCDDEVTFEETYTVDSNITVLDIHNIIKDSAIRFTIDIDCNNGYLDFNYLVLCDAINAEHNTNANNSSSNFSSYSNIHSNLLLDNYVNYNPNDRESYNNLYNSDNNILKEYFNTLNNGDHEYYSNTDRVRCYHSNSQFETPFIEIPDSGFNYYLSMFVNTRSDISIKIKTYDDSFAVVSSTRIKDDVTSNIHEMINTKYTCKNRQMGLVEAFIVSSNPINSSSELNNIANIRYNDIENKGLFIPATHSEVIQYNSNVKYVKFVISGNTSVIKPLLTYLCNTVTSEGCVNMGFIQEKVNMPDSLRRII